mgnify:CR=1 FL=1
MRGVVAGCDAVVRTRLPHLRAVLDQKLGDLRHRHREIDETGQHRVARHAVIRSVRRAPPDDEPAVPTLEDVDYRYRCIVCGAQLVMYTAQGGEVPDAPRHCREPMVLMTPIDDAGTTPS